MDVWTPYPRCDYLVPRCSSDWLSLAWITRTPLVRALGQIVSLIGGLVSLPEVVPAYA